MKTRINHDNKYCFRNTVHFFLCSKKAKGSIEHRLPVLTERMPTFARNVCDDGALDTMELCLIFTFPQILRQRRIWNLLLRAAGWSDLEICGFQWWEQH